LAANPSTPDNWCSASPTATLSQDIALQGGDTQSLMAHQQEMQLRLRSMLKNIGSTVASTEGAAQTLAGSSQQVAAASRSASDSAASMAAVVEEMSVSISQVADNARDALKTASHAAELSDSGGGVIEQATSAINRIADTVRQTSGAMRALDESATRISTVVQVIKEVADQTNLLALNAAIEAARAGESGRGFAVVADEVRKLAERTGKATNEINGMVPTASARSMSLPKPIGALRPSARCTTSPSARSACRSPSCMRSR
jgi:methyl-accepting chemotaxis protein